MCVFAGACVCTVIPQKAVITRLLSLYNSCCRLSLWIVSLWPPLNSHSRGSFSKPMWEYVCVYLHVNVKATLVLHPCIIDLCDKSFLLTFAALPLCCVRLDSFTTERLGNLQHTLNRHQTQTNFAQSGVEESVCVSSQCRQTCFTRSHVLPCAVKPLQPRQ